MLGRPEQQVIERKSVTGLHSQHMAGRQPRARSLSIFLIKEGISAPRDILLDEDALSKSKVSAGREEIGDLYVKPTVDSLPSWLSIFQGALRPDIQDSHNASSAAVFLVEAVERLFAITFGYGRNLLRPGVWDEDFGLKVTLNAVDASRIKSIDRLKFDAISQHSQIQASRDASILEFGLDVEQDLLRAVTGKPVDLTLASQLTGKDALKADVRVELPGIRGLLGRFLEAFHQITYRDHFSFVDNIHELRDPIVVGQLDEVLIERINAREFDRLYLAIPDLVDWEGVSGFKYRDSHRGTLYPDIHFRTFLEVEGQDFHPTIPILKKSRRVYLMSHENDLAVRAWPIYRCIYFETDRQGETFLLNNGKWYRVRTDFLQLVNGSFDEVVSDRLRLPDFAHPDEQTYNESVARGDPGNFCLMDRRLVPYPTERDQVEFCDLYSRNRLIIHVKRYRGSATLSHLFSQGLVSAELFCTSPDFRFEVNKLLEEPFRLADTRPRPPNDTYEVVFAIASKSRNPLTLPFFSRVNLRNAVQRLCGFGYRVSVTKVQEAA